MSADLTTLDMRTRFAEVAGEAEVRYIDEALAELERTTRDNGNTHVVLSVRHAEALIECFRSIGWEAISITYSGHTSALPHYVFAEDGSVDEYAEQGEEETRQNRSQSVESDDESTTNNDNDKETTI